MSTGGLCRLRGTTASAYDGHIVVLLGDDWQPAACVAAFAA
jgi:hypothetical protein